MIKWTVAMVLAACLIGGCGGAEQSDTPGTESDARATVADTGSTGPGEPVDAESDTSAERALSSEPESTVETGQDTDGADTEASESVGDAAEGTEAESDVEEGRREPASAEGESVPETVTEGERVVAPSGLSVVRAYVCKGIEQSEPTEAGKSFIPEDDGVLRLCCFSEIAGAATPDTIYHVWRWGEREMARVALEVKSARWRTWSSKRILDEWRGEWHVDIVDRDGFRLERLDFSVE